MPEGDTIFRAARTLERALAGKRVTRFETVLAHLARVDDQSPIAGRTIERVSAAGKHLLIEFSGGLTLRTHMRMSGSWHIYRPGERWQRPRSEMRVVVATDDFVAVAFSVPVAEFLTGSQRVRQEDLRKIGPDFLGETFDVDEAVRRMRARGDSEIAVVLLNQRVVAGVGNIFKSETLFVSGIDPFRHVASLSDEELKTIVTNARKLMAQNVKPSSGEGIITRSGLGRRKPVDRVWVYGRGGKACHKCGTAIAYRKQGIDARGTYWCPTCQR